MAPVFLGQLLSSLVRIESTDLIDSAEVAEIVGLSRRQAVITYRQRYSDFPVPVIEKGRCLLWRRQDVEAWARSRRPS
jgi:predicted DNA-binding transcriptional regulator AlpA